MTRGPGAMPPAPQPPVQPAYRRRRVVRVLLVLGIVMVLVAATVVVWVLVAGEKKRAARPLPSTWPTPGAQEVRPFPMPTGQMVVALPRAVQDHVLCQALPESRWRDILGSPVLREVRHGLRDLKYDSGEFNGCHVVTPEFDVTVTEWPSFTVVGRTVEIEGRLAHIYRQPAGKETESMRVSLRVPFIAGVDKTDGSAGAMKSTLLGIELDSRSGSEDSMSERIVALAREILLATTKPDLELPEPGEREEIPSRLVEPVPGYGISGAAEPMISWQLCSVLAAELGVDITEAKASFSARCEIAKGGLSLKGWYSDMSRNDIQYNTTIAGRPASMQHVVIVKIRDDTDELLHIVVDGRESQSFDLRGFAERAVPRLIGR